MTRLLGLGLVLTLAACSGPKPKPSVIVVPGTSVIVTNKGDPATVYVSFGADSQIQAADWASFCTSTSALTCHFSLAGSRALPNGNGSYLNMTLAVGAPVACGATKAEINVNNPAWYDTLDVSLVDGYSGKIEILYTSPTGTKTRLGPPNGPTGNEKVLGVYPYGCDICVARQNPPCGIPKGTDGCKTGGQYDPSVPCQVQGAVKGGGGIAEVIFWPPEPAAP